jgi:hypothetical protein
MGGMALMARLCDDEIGKGGKERRGIGPTGRGLRETGGFRSLYARVGEVIRLDKWDGLGRMMRDELGKTDIASGYG